MLCFVEQEDKEQNLSGAVEDATAKAPVLANVQPTDKSAAASTTVSKVGLAVCR